jgi:hypothetical protein
VGDELAALPHEEAPPPQQVAGLPFGPRVGVGQREQTAPEHGGQLAGVDLVALGLALVDVLHGQGVAEGERDALVVTQVGQPVPGEHALAADDQVLAVGLDRPEERLRVGGQVLLEDRLALVVQDVDEHGPGVQVDAAVKSVLAIVGHLMPSPVTGRPDPASWLGGTTPP